MNALQRDLPGRRSGSNSLVSQKSLEEQKEELSKILGKFTSHEIFQSEPPVRVAYCERTQQFEKLMDLAVPPFLAQFPTSPGTWDKELIQFADSLLELFSRGSLRLDGLFLGETHRECTWVPQLIAFVRHMNTWDRRHPDIQEGDHSPSQLADRAVGVAANLLVGLGMETLEGQKGPIPWRRFRTIVRDLLSFCKDLLVTSSKTYPFTLALTSSEDTKTEHDPFDDSSHAQHTEVTISSETEAHDLAIAILNILSRTITHPLPCKSFVADLVNTVLGLSCKAAQLIIESRQWGGSATSKPDRAAIAISSRGIETIIFLLEDHTIFTSASPAPALVCRCLAARAELSLDSVQVDFAWLDKLIHRGVIAIPDDSMPAVFTEQLSEALTHETCGAKDHDLRHAIYVYLSKCITTQTDSVISSTARILDDAAFVDDPGLATLKNLYALHGQQNVDIVSEPLLGKRKRSHGWREEGQELLENVVRCGSKFWNDLATADDAHWLKAVLNGISVRFTESLEHLGLSGRGALANALLKWVSAIDAASMGSTSPDKPPVPSRPLLPTLLSAALKLLDGDSPGRPTVPRATYSFLAVAVRYGVTNSVPPGDVLRLAKNGMMHQDRLARVAASRIFVAYIEAYQEEGVDVTSQCDRVVGILVELCESSPQATRESAISALSAIGRIANDVLLGHVMRSLIAQWAQESTLLRSLAFVQLSDIARRRQKTAYSLLSPYLPQTIVYVTANLRNAPSLLTELGRFLSHEPSELLAFTLSHSLPSLVTTCSRDEINLVARIVGRPVAALLVDKTTDILKGIYLLPDDKDVEESLNFLTQMVAEAAGAKAGSVGTQALVNSCIATLLAELVMVFGDERSKTAEMALKALARVERTTWNAKQHGKMPRDLATFLKPHILGIMTYLNEVLQDVQGRRSPEYKKQVVRSIGELIKKIGSPISAIAPQIMAAMQSVLHIPEFTAVTLTTWHVFMTELSFRDIGPYIGSTSAAFVKGWLNFEDPCREIASKILNYLVVDNIEDIREFITDIVSLEGIQELGRPKRRLERLLNEMSETTKMDMLLQRCCSDNVTVASLSLLELKHFLGYKATVVQKWASGDVFDSTISAIVHVLLSAASRDGDAFNDLRLTAYECFGLLGALDPDRFEPRSEETAMIVLHNFRDEGEAVSFALHLIRNLLVGAFRSTSDLRYQSHLAYAIQELLKFCQFTSDLVKGAGGNSVPLRVRNRWESLPKHMLDTVAPLLEGKFSHDVVRAVQYKHPIYNTAMSYRDWAQQWASFLIDRASGEQARTIFGSFRLAVRSQDAEVARYLIPYLVLNTLISGTEDDSENIRIEIVTILQAQIERRNDDRQLLVAQTVFEVIDHLSTWIRLRRQFLARKRGEATRRSRTAALNTSDDLEEAMQRVDSMISSIDPDLLATAALQCKAYARALVTLERLISARREAQISEEDLQPYYERLHLIYANLEEPDGMEGVTTKVAMPTLDHQIREHESTGRWTSAQSCWELKLQQAPDNVDLHLGLLRCLRNLGHHDTLLTHVKGIFTQHPNWLPQLAGLYAEGAVMTGDWDAVRSATQSAHIATPEITIANLFLALRTRESSNVSAAFRDARNALGAPLTAGGRQSYRHLYGTVIHLHIVHELQMIYSSDISLTLLRSPTNNTAVTVNRLRDHLAARFERTQPSYTAREPILSMRRTGFGICSIPPPYTTVEIGRAWMASAKFARKAGYSQTAYSSNLQAAHWKAPYAYIESCKLLRSGGDGLRALQELDNTLKGSSGQMEEIMSEDNGPVLEHKNAQKLRAKALLLRARWMHEAERYSEIEIRDRFQEPMAASDDWESPWYHLGRFHDEIVKQGNPRPNDPAPWVSRSHYSVVKAYSKALRLGSKYTYQTMPRMLTVWLDPAEHPQLVELERTSRRAPDGNLAEVARSQTRINQVIQRAIKELPVYQWMTAFPQIVSRIGHPNPAVYGIIADLVVTILCEYPQQGLWYFTPVVQGKSAERERRGKAILARVQQSAEGRGDTANLVKHWITLTKELLYLSDADVKTAGDLDMKKQFPALYRLCPMPLILPLQESLTAVMPASSSLKDAHHPFRSNAPTFHEFQEEISVMPSLVKPKRVTIRGSDGSLYSFLCKPKDDLRKDARLMDFFSMINKLLKADSESRRRRLHIRTYAVLPLNETCGLIEWVPNVIPMRLILQKLYEARGMTLFSRSVQEIIDAVRKSPDSAAVQFSTKILPLYPVVFHEWFLATWPEPSAWLSSRLEYARTSAVMAMVGSILGLGDRHGENILLDSISGAIIHVDFNCLFDKGKGFDVPERVPFRLTQNIVDGLGVTGVEGVFRKASEITMQILRVHKDSLMNVLEAYVHDPLVEWEDERMKREREIRLKGAPKASRSGSASSSAGAPALRDLAIKYLGPVERRLRGLHGSKTGVDKALNTLSYVDWLIKEAGDPGNLGSMYQGWAAWL